MKCENCGATIDHLEVNVFNYDGTDTIQDTTFEECDDHAVVIEVGTEWTGYELTEEEALETITCPRCHKWPFKSTELQQYTIIRLVMFKSRDEEE